MCCAFNLLAAEEMYQDDGYPHYINRLQEIGRQLSFDNANLPLGQGYRLSFFKMITRMFVHFAILGLNLKMYHF
jgi:hypothetical protein